MPHKTHSVFMQIRDTLLIISHVTYQGFSSTFQCETFWLFVALYELIFSPGGVRSGCSMTPRQEGVQAADRCLTPHQGWQLQLYDFLQHFRVVFCDDQNWAFFSLDDGKYADSDNKIWCFHGHVSVLSSFLQIPFPTSPSFAGWTSQTDKTDQLSGETVAEGVGVSLTAKKRLYFLSVCDYQSEEL